MRADLFTHPKVVRISSALKADTLRTVGGLMSVWCLFDAHSEDGKLDGYTPEVLDEHVRWGGFSAAMVSVGWLEVGPSGSLFLPRFDTHNGQSAKRRAQDADRKREDRKTSAPEADKKRTREEKRREDKTYRVAEHPLPDWLPADAWIAFCEMRRLTKKPITTARTANGVLKDLDALRKKGHSPVDVLDEATKRNWLTVYEPKGSQPTAPVAQFAGAR